MKRSWSFLVKNYDMPPNAMNAFQCIDITQFISIILLWITPEKYSKKHLFTSRPSNPYTARPLPHGDFQNRKAAFEPKLTVGGPLSCTSIIARWG
jgi:hypothetical protein